MYKSNYCNGFTLNHSIMETEYSDATHDVRLEYFEFMYSRKSEMCALHEVKVVNLKV